MGQRRGDGTSRWPRVERLGDLPYQDNSAAPRSGGFVRRAGNRWERRSLDDFRHDVTQVAQGLIASGVAAGDRVVLACGTRYEWALVAFAVWAVRGVLVPVHLSCSAARFQHVVRDALPTVVIMESERHARAVAGIQREPGNLTRVCRLDAPPGSGAGGWMNPGLAPIVSAGTYMAASAVLFRREETTRDDIAVIAHPATTGTRSRGVVLTHRNLLACAESLLARTGDLIDGIPEGDASALIHVPLAEAFAQTLLVTCLMAGVRVGFPSGRSALMPEIRRFAPTILLAHPHLLDRAYALEHAAEQEKSKNPGWDNLSAFDAATEHAITYGQGGRRGMWRRISHAMHDWLYTRIRDRFGGRVAFIVCIGGVPERFTHFFNGAGLPIVQGVGMAETAGPLAIDVIGKSPSGGVGRLLPGVGVRVSPTGEIQVSGATVARGYWNAPAATVAAFHEGWFATGLTGRLTPDGVLILNRRARRRPPAPEASDAPPGARAALPPAAGRGGPAPAQRPERPAPPAETPPPPDAKARPARDPGPEATDILDASDERSRQDIAH